MLNLLQTKLSLIDDDALLCPIWCVYKIIPHSILWEGTLQFVQCATILYKNK